MAKVQLTRTDVPTSARAGQTVNVTAAIDVISWTDVWLNAWLNVYVKETGTGIIHWADVLRFGIAATKSGTFTMPEQDVTVVFEAYHHDGATWIRDAYTERSVTLAKITPVINCAPTPTTLIVGGICTFVATLGEYGEAYPGKLIRFYLNDTYVGSATTYAYGGIAIAKLSYKTTGVGTFTVKAAFGGDATLNPAQATATITVESIEVVTTKFANVIVDKTTVAIGDSVKLSGYLQDIYGAGLSYKPVDFYAGGKVGTITSGYNGYCEGRFYPTAASAGATVGMFFKFLGDADYLTSISALKYVSVVEVVTATKLTISANKTTAKVGEEITFTGRLTDYAGTGLAIKEIDLYKDGVNITAGLLQKNLTGWNGNYTIKYTPTPEDGGKALQFYTRFAGDII